MSDEAIAAAQAAVEEMNALSNALLEREDAHVAAMGAAVRSGDAVTAADEKEKARLVRLKRNRALKAGIQLDRKIIAWLDGAPEVAAARARLGSAVADLERTRQDFARTADTLTALSAALDRVGGVITALQKLLGP